MLAILSAYDMTITDRWLFLVKPNMNLKSKTEVSFGYSWTSGTETAINAGYYCSGFYNQYLKIIV